MRWLAVGLLVAATGATTTYQVHSLRQRLKSSPSPWSRDIAEVTEGCRVAELGVKGAWGRVSAQCPSWSTAREGFLPRASYTGVDLAGVSRSGSGIVANERTASTAARGFSREVEQKHLAQHGDLKAAYDALDAYEKTAETARQEGAAFAAKGKLEAEVAP